MTLQRTVHSPEMLDLLAAAEDAMAQVPPAFPLSATVAVNPYLGQAGEDRATATARLNRVAGISPLRARAEIAAEIEAGEITDEDIEQAAVAADLDAAMLRAAAGTPAAPAAPHPSVAELAAKASGVDWPRFVEERIGHWAAAAFDEGQALWPALAGKPFSTWRAYAAHDLSPEIAGLTGFAKRVAALPDCPRSALANSAVELGLTPSSAPICFHRLLMQLGGWAQVARGQRWLAERDGGHHDTLLALLAIRLCWEAALLDRYRDAVAAAWAETCAAMAAPVAPAQGHRIDAALHDAADRAAERRLVATFAEGSAQDAERGLDRPKIQAAFCIDVRSEVFRRALESTDAGIETIGFAGFFGIAANHRGAASDIEEARAPVLLSPGMASSGALAADDDHAMRLSHRAVRAWGRFRQAAVSAFAFVEAAGPIYAIKLARDALGHAHAHDHDHASHAAPRLDLTREDRAGLAAGVLRAMSLTGDFAPIVLLAGHGAHVVNAPHASALQCGACGGHAGDVNARLLAGLLNDTEVRGDLDAWGIEIPEETVFVAGLHDTVSDRVTLYEDDLPAGAHKRLGNLRAALKAAGRLARADRARRLPRAADPESLLKRGADWSEIRAEWGLAGCSAFIAAPRARSAGRDLGGSVFLHNYDWQADRSFATLELIMTAPVVVASWIALQYHGSALSPEAFGGGNKLLHNVTGGIGVVEGNGGNLRAGLPWQSLHDGETLQHRPTRLKVVIEAPVEAISAVLHRHAELRALFDNGWLSLHAMDEQGRIAARYDAGSWTRMVPGDVDAGSIAA
ncbi:MAG: DUF2309 domain-containing protein [Pseudomonadota bacterium]